jgi:hypothetical protein
MAWMDADDLMTPDRIMLQTGMLKSDSDVDLVSSDFSAFVDVNADMDASHIDKYYSGVGQLGGLARIYPKSHEVIVSGYGVTIHTGQVYLSLLYGNFVHPPTVMVRLKLFDRIGFFDETLRYTSDGDSIIRAARIARFAYIDRPLLRYRLSDKQMSHNAAGGKLLLETIDILERVQRDDPDTYLNQQQLFRRRFAELHIRTADLIGPSNRRMALRLLIRGVRHEFLVGPAVHALARIVVPRFAVRTAKAAWRFLRSMRGNASS